MPLTKRRLILTYAIVAFLVGGAILYANDPALGDANSLILAGACAARPAGSPDSLFGPSDATPCPGQTASNDADDDHTQTQSTAPAPSPSQAPQDMQNTSLTVYNASPPSPSPSPQVTHVYITVQPAAHHDNLPATGGTARP